MPKHRRHGGEPEGRARTGIGDAPPSAPKRSRVKSWRSSWPLTGSVRMCMTASIAAAGPVRVGVRAVMEAAEYVLANR